MNGPRGIEARCLASIELKAWGPQASMLEANSPRLELLEV